ncbi:MAG: chromosome segregation protein SMC [Bdellovibrionaceae bacterium]|nr:chromosome segregation protein SMC [Pseudobdellovibrionaceae bacterium]
MRIKKLELVGFKSFKDKTVIQFDAGITGVVGPNGCGKSNIVDGLVWVMGEMSAKDLRGSTMTDVIFAGAEGYAPLGMCEVSLTLENDGGAFPIKYLKHTEIMVTRRLHRNGEGEYFINKEPARLKDVQEIFMDTGAGSKGFSIIQQGMIGKIITSKPEDRRHLIEEAAGITKFKARKKESQRKLQQTDQNLVRLQDIIGELKRQIDSLQRQAQRAERYRNLKNQVEDLDLWLSSKQYLELKNTADEAQRLFNEAQVMEVEGESQLASLQSEFETLKLQVLEKEKEVEVLQNSYYEKQSQVSKKEMEIQELRFEIEQARRNEQMTGSLMQEQQARLELLIRDEDSLKAQSEQLKSDVDTLQAQFQDKNEIFKKDQARIQEVDDLLTEKRRELFALGQSLNALEAKTQGLDNQITDLEEREGNEQLVANELREKNLEFESRRNRIFSELEKNRQLSLDLNSDVDSFEANKKILNQQVFEKKEEVEEFKDLLGRTTSSLYGLENLQSSFEGFESGVKSVLLWQKSKIQKKQTTTQTEMHADGSVTTYETESSEMDSGESEFKPVSDVVEVEPGYEVAMEAALGQRLQMLLAQDPKASVDAIQYLKNSRSGRSSFLSVDSARDRGSDQTPQNEAGVKVLLRDVVRSKPEFEKSVNYFVDHIAVVEDLNRAIQLRAQYPGWTFVTVDGDSVTNEGVISGGSKESSESGILHRKNQIKELTAQKNEWAGKLSLAQLALKKLEEQLHVIVTDFEGAQKRKVEQELKVRELQKDLDRAEQELVNAQYAVERQEREIKKIQDQANSLREKQNEFATNLEDVRIKKFDIEELVKSLDSELEVTQKGFPELQQIVTELQVELASKSQEYSGVTRQLDMVSRSLSDLQSQLSRMTEETEMYSEKMTESQYALEEKKIEFEKWLTSLEDLKQNFSAEKNHFEEISNSLSGYADKLASLQKAKNDRLSLMNDAQLKLDQARLKEQYLVDQVRERYLLQLPDVVHKYVDRTGDSYLAETELKELKEKLSRIGEVNLSAIEEYDETTKRYEFLTKQYDDLVEAKEQLRRVIDRINRICSKKFKETFDLVNERFTRVFPVLFGGGEAKLELHEDPEKTEMGIEIIARPPGKKMQNVSLMSGGEKALTAVALVFSIFLVKPSPYCLLDEVDAPLDDANVFRFNDLVREMSKRSQIIVVTHNKHTMEVAKKLYGVTMQERGVSTMVSVSLQDIH